MGSAQVSSIVSSAPKPRFRLPTLGALMLTAASLLAVGCGDEKKETGPADEGDLTTKWKSGAGDLATLLREERLFEDIAGELNKGFAFPRDLPIVHMSCGEENAFYNGREIQMCYELLDQIQQVSLDLSSTDDELGQRIVGTWAFIFFHELGHALSDVYELPITGKEEDAVDQFSTVLLIEADLSDFAILAADYWAATDSGMYNETYFADEHSLNPQRFYNILCLVYGSDPDRYEALVTEGYLPEARAARCPSEYQQTRDAWFTLLEPWAK